MSEAKIHRCLNKVHEDLFKRVLSGRAPQREAVKAQCIECIGYIDVVKEIKNCADTMCPLYRYRPYMKPGEKRGKGTNKDE